MIKLDSSDELAKAAAILNKAMGSLHGHFKAAGAHHESLHAHHTTMAAAMKAKHDAMADDHEDKAFVGKLHEHHTQKAAIHKAHSDHCMSMSKEYEAAKAEEPTTIKAVTTPVSAAGNDTGEGVAALINKTTDSLVAKALEALNSDPKVAEKIQEIVLQRVNAALGDKIVPDNVRGVVPTNPNLKLIPRPGDKAADGATDLAKARTEVAPELAEMLG